MEVVPCYDYNLVCNYSSGQSNLSTVAFNYLPISPLLYILKAACYFVLPFSVNTSNNYRSLFASPLSVSLCPSISVQISLLKQSLELQLSQSQSALQQLQSQFNQERELLSQQLKGEGFWPFYSNRKLQLRNWHRSISS